MTTMADSRRRPWRRKCRKKKKEERDRVNGLRLTIQQHNNAKTIGTRLIKQMRQTHGNWTVEIERSCPRDDCGRWMICVWRLRYFGWIFLCVSTLALKSATWLRISSQEIAVSSILIHGHGWPRVCIPPRVEMMTVHSFLDPTAIYAYSLLAKGSQKEISFLGFNFWHQAWS